MSDSESSGDEAYTVTNVLLGYTTKEPKDDEISHLGGRPSWIDIETPPSGALAKCKICNDLMVLLLQLNGELPEFNGHERRLYVLTCRRKTCRRKEGSVRVLRGVRITEVAPKKTNSKDVQPKGSDVSTKPATAPIGSLFGTQTNPFSSPTNPFSTGGSATPANPFSSTPITQNPFATSKLATQASTVPANPPPKPFPPDSSELPKTFASALSLNNTPIIHGPPEPWPEESSFPLAYPLYYLDPDYEELDAPDIAPVPTQTMDLEETSGGGKEDKEVFESTIDSTFQKFADRLAQNPDQVLRYEYGGQPLLYSKNDVVGKVLAEGKGKLRKGGMTRCGNCGASRVFELQLTPHLIMELEREQDGLDGMEWGTIIVGVCERDCQQRGVDGGVGYVEEWAGVQWEELGERR